MTTATEQSNTWLARRQEIGKRQQRGYIDRVRAGHGDLSPDGAMENDARVYTDPTRYERELTTLFKEFPILACLSQDLREQGSIFVFEELDVSIIITRAKDGTVNAFLNTCTHRAAKLIEAPCQKNLITCPFHGWSFSHDGKLVGIPEGEAFENIDREKRSLISVPVTEWAGMIFILPRAGHDKIDIESHLGDFAIELEQLELQNAEPVKAGTLQAACNWKYALDTYGEGYHFPVLHKNTVARVNSSHTQYDNFGRHHRIGWAPVGAAQWANMPEDEWPTPQYGGVHYIFPNTIIYYGSVNDTEPFVQVFRHFPDGVGAMKTHLCVYMPGGVSDEAQKTLVETAGFDGTAHVVDTEDYWIASNGWASLAKAPEGFKVIYGANELALQDQHRNLADATGMPLDIYDR